MKKLCLILLLFVTGYSATAQNCPTSFNVISPAMPVSEGDTLTFTAVIDGGPSGMTYNWTISAGTIISGQGTSIIKVNTEGLAGVFVTATLELGGIPANCNRTASSTTDVMPAPVKISSLDYTTAQALTGAVQKFIAQIKLNDLSVGQTGFVFIYRGPATTDAQVKSFFATIKSAFTNKGILEFQYRILEGGKRKKTSFEFYQVKDGMNDPKPNRQ